MENSNSQPGDQVASRSRSELPRPSYLSLSSSGLGLWLKRQKRPLDLVACGIHSLMWQPASVSYFDFDYRTCLLRNQIQARLGESVEVHENGMGAIVNAGPGVGGVRKHPRSPCFKRRREAIGGENAQRGSEFSPSNEVLETPICSTIMGGARQPSRCIRMTKRCDQESTHSRVSLINQIHKHKQPQVSRTRQRILSLSAVDAMISQSSLTIRSEPESVVCRTLAFQES